MSDDIRPLAEMAVLAAAMLIAGVAAMLQRRPIIQPDWPPSPRPTREIRRDRIILGSSLFLLICGVGIGIIVAAAAVLQAPG